MSQPPDFDQLRSALPQLSLQQAKQLYAELQEHIGALESQSVPSEPGKTKGREVVETQRMGKRIYQLERVRCGKIGCKCARENGKLHGPYWYAYWREGGKLKSRYVGKQLRQIK